MEAASINMSLSLIGDYCLVMDSTGTGIGSAGNGQVTTLPGVAYRSKGAISPMGSSVNSSVGGGTSTFFGLMGSSLMLVSAPLLVKFTTREYYAIFDELSSTY